jgi:hypothetical protein
MFLSLFLKTEVYEAGTALDALKLIIQIQVFWVMTPYILVDS